MKMTQKRALESLKLSNANNYTELHAAYFQARCETIKDPSIDGAYKFLYLKLSETDFKKGSNAFVAKHVYVKPTPATFNLSFNFQMFHFNHKNEFDNFAGQFQNNLRHFEIIPNRSNKLTEQGKVSLLDFLLNQPKLESAKLGNLFKANESVQIKNMLKKLGLKLNIQAKKAERKRFKKKINLINFELNHCFSAVHYSVPFLILMFTSLAMSASLFVLSLINPAILINPIVVSIGAALETAFLLSVAIFVPSFCFGSYLDYMMRKGGAFNKTHCFDKADDKQLKKEAISPRQLNAIEAGIEAGRSWRGYFASYSNSSAYELTAFHAGRRLVLENNLHKLDQVKKLRA